MAALIPSAGDEEWLHAISTVAGDNIKWLLKSLEEPFADCQDIYAQYENEIFEETHHTAKKTDYYRDMVWSKWLIFSKKLEIDPEAPWIDLSLDKDSAKNICFSFLHSYVVNSRVWRPCLGPEEWHKVQTVTCAVTVEDIWSALVQNANRKILRPKTKEGSEDSRRWELNFSTRHGRHSEGPAYDVARRIPELAQTLNISLKQSFTKRQMTTEDVLLFLDTLWTKAEYISCSPSIRNAIHCVILLGAFGGWRPGSLMNVKYKDVEFGWFVHPKYPNKIWPVATITVRHVKQKINKVERTQRSM
ncbi:hypothetical protein V8C37DRAFT_419575 [Trichoderma ceciliae]